ncbi:uncharacterized protein LOC142326969 [Lycorma delicatula]|uniref:uncharacterized protein LOC142326969 n=1 Tax=Lycorma delicatula TaxID=130591 RepID=UPI003F5125C2
MGCVSSKKDINDIHPNMFQVSNVDERGNKLHRGQLEVTETDLVLYHRGKAPLKWPLRSLRRYGFDSELFSFESGRRCPTGPGVYAFRCHRAEQLFNILQTHIQMRNNSTDDTISREFAPAPPPSLPPNRQMGVDGNYLEPTPFRQNSNRFSLLNGPSRINSVGSNSNGPLSPQGTGSPSPPPAVANNNYANEEVFNKAELEKHRTLCHSYSNTTSLSLAVPHENAPPLVIQNISCTDKTPVAVVPVSPTGSLASDCIYTRLDETATIPVDENLDQVPSSPVYMNVVPGLENISTDEPPPRPLSKPDRDPDEPKHCYENLEPGEIEGLSRSLTLKVDRTVPHSISLHSSLTLATGQSSQPLTPPSLATHHQVINYVVLDLDQTPSRGENVPPSPLSTTHNSSQVPDSPNKQTERYAMIDFDRTVALSHSVNPNAENDSEGSRKTRHNSTIPADFSSTGTNRFSNTQNE